MIRGDARVLLQLLRGQPRHGSHYWSTHHNTVVQKVLKRARHGTDVVFVPGNHDEALREHIDTSFGQIRLVYDHIHTAADGRRYLLTHGDEFDQVTKYHRWVAVLGDNAYALVLRLNALLSWVRRRLGIPGYWSLSSYAKRKVKGAVSFIFDFEDSVTRYVRERGVDGVICGHIHAAAIKDLDGITYINCGDWVDSCTAILEHDDGRMELIDWGMQSRQPKAHPLKRPQPPPRHALPEVGRTPAAAREVD